jgi:eukaryotic-like serine/threonine-protein kinase
MTFENSQDVPLDIQRKIDAVCLEFEDAWRGGKEPSIATFVKRGEADWEKLLRAELLRVDLEMRGKAKQAAGVHHAHDMGAHASYDGAKATCRSLLFGVLALQMNFISRDQWIAAMNAWALNKQKALIELLRESGAIAERHLALLQPLVEAHIQHHEGDPEQSLAALHGVSNFHEEFSALGNIELTESLAKHSTAHGKTVRSPRPAPGPMVKAAGRQRFQFLRFHARGGLGQVSVALDTELNREVALKEIRPEFADDPAFRARFIQEAEINGGLEHPGIVPVYSLGAYSDGRPFYAMRFIKGDSLRHAGERFHQSSKTDRGPWEGSVEFRKLLGQLIDACHAIAYAHSRKVLHRDLKPGNVMVGKYGETLVVDWGLAKVQGRDGDTDYDTSEASLRPASGSEVDPTLAGARIGTLQYMSPEQARGELSRLGPASDVYSLGATLYFLMTGRPPITSDDDDPEHLAKTGTFPAPRVVNPRIPRPLESICLKAMAFEPDHRYRSAADLADELERWLSDQSVLAHRETLVERTGRWTRRHRSLAVTLATALILLAAISAASAATISFYWRDAEIARRGEATAKAQAQELYMTARDSVDRRSVQLSKLLKHAPGTLPMAERLLAESLEDYERFAQYQTDQPNLELLRGKAWHSIGDIHAARGSKSDAAKYFRRAEEHFRQFNLRFPQQEVQGDVELGRTYNRLGSVLAAEGQNEGAVDLWQRTTGLLQKRSASLGDDAERRSVLITAHFSVAESELESSQIAKAHEQIEAALQLLPSSPSDEAIGRTPADDRLLRLRLSLWQLRGRVHATQAQWGQAQADFEQALAAAEQLGRRHADDPADVSLAAGVQIDLATVQRALRRPEQELAAYQSALNVYRQLVAQYPLWLTSRPELDGREHEASLLQALALTRIDRAQLLLDLQRMGEAQMDLAEAIPIFEQLLTAHPDDPQFREEYAAALEAQGRLLFQQGQYIDARVAQETSLHILTDLVDHWPQIMIYRQRAALSRSQLAQTLAALGEQERADSEFRQALTQMELLVQAAPDMPVLHNHIAHLHARWAFAFWRHGKAPEATLEFQRAIQFWEGMTAKWPRGDHRLAYADLLANCPIPALRDSKRAADLARASHNDFTSDPLAGSVLAGALFRQGRFQECARVLSDQSSGGYQLARDDFLQAMLLHETVDPASAQRAYDRGETLRRNRLGDQDLEQFAKEAAAVLGL